MQELAATLDKEIAALEKECASQSELTVNLSTKMVMAYVKILSIIYVYRETNVKKSQKLRKECSDAIQKTLDSATQMQSKMEDLEREMNSILNSFNAARQVLL